MGMGQGSCLLFPILWLVANSCSTKGMVETCWTPIKNGINMDKLSIAVGFRNRPQDVDLWNIWGLHPISPWNMRISPYSKSMSWAHEKAGIDRSKTRQTGWCCSTWMGYHGDRLGYHCLLLTQIGDGPKVPCQTILSNNSSAVDFPSRRTTLAALDGTNPKNSGHFLATPDFTGEIPSLAPVPPGALHLPASMVQVARKGRRKQENTSLLVVFRASYWGGSNNGGTPQ